MSRKYEFHVQLDTEDVQVIRDAYGWGALAKLVRVFVMALATRIRNGQSVAPAADAERFVATIFQENAGLAKEVKADG